MSSRIASAACSAACRMSLLSSTGSRGLHAILLWVGPDGKGHRLITGVPRPVTVGWGSCHDDVHAIGGDRRGGPRDGLQNEAAVLTTEAKLELIARLAASGVRRIEATSFVQPGPGPADGRRRGACGRGCPGGDGRRGSGWCSTSAASTGPSRAGVDEVNVRRRGDRHLQPAQPGRVAWTRRSRRGAGSRAGRAAAGLRATVTVAAAFGCPFEGEVAPERVAEVLARRVQAPARRGGAGRHHRRRRARRGARPGRRRRRRGGRPAAALPLPQHPQHRLRQRGHRGRARRGTRWTPARAGSAAARSHPRPPATSPPRTCCTCWTGRGWRPACPRRHCCRWRGSCRRARHGGAGPAGPGRAFPG